MPSVDGAVFAGAGDAWRSIVEQVQADVAAAELAIAGLQEASLSNDYRINIRSYGAVADATGVVGVGTDNYTFIENARQTARTLGLRMYAPKGIYRFVLGGARPTHLEIDWDHAEICGDGANTVFQMERAAVGIVGCFRVVSGLNAHFHDLAIEGVGMLATLNADPNTHGIATARMTGNTGINIQRHYVRIERCWISGVESPVWSEGHSFAGSQQHLIVADCDLTAYVVCVSSFDYPTSNGKFCTILRNNLRCFDINAECSGHSAYVGAQVSLRIEGNNFWAFPPLGWAAFKHFSSGEITGKAKFCIVKGNWFAPGYQSSPGVYVGGCGYSMILGKHCAAIVTDNHIHCSKGAQIRNDTIWMNNHVIATPTDGTGFSGVFAYDEGPGESTPNPVTVMVGGGSTFDFSLAGAENCVGVSCRNLASTQVTWKVRGVLAKSSAANTGSSYFLSSQVLDAVETAGPIVIAEDNDVQAFDDPTNNSRLGYAYIASGKWRIKGGSISGDTAALVGAIRMDAGADVIGVDIDGFDFSGITRGAVLYLTAAGAGKITGRNCNYGDNPDVHKLASLGGIQRLVPRAGTCLTVVTAPATSLPAWAASTLVQVGERQRNGVNNYIVTAITTGITAGSGGPTGTGTGIVDGGATWAFVAASTTTKLATISPNYDTFDSDAVITDMFTQGTFAASQCFEGREIRIFSGPTGTLRWDSLTANCVPLNTDARPAGTCARWRYKSGLWREFI
jgi:hypothetical protein